MKRLQQLLVKKNGSLHLLIVPFMQLGSISCTALVNELELTPTVAKSSLDILGLYGLNIVAHVLSDKSTSVTIWRQIGPCFTYPTHWQAPTHAPLSVLPCVIHNCVQPVCYCQHRAVFKLSPNCHLDKIICLQIDSCRCFI